MTMSPAHFKKQFNACGPVKYCHKHIRSRIIVNWNRKGRIRVITIPKMQKSPIDSAAGTTNSSGTGPGIADGLQFQKKINRTIRFLEINIGRWSEETIEWMGKRKQRDSSATMRLFVHGIRVNTNRSSKKKLHVFSTFWNKC